jgi:hypothetical protein
MKYHACVTSALNQKIIDQPMADELNADIEAYRNKAIKEGHSEAQLDAIATKMALTQMAIKKKRAKHQKALQVISMARNLENIKSHPRGMEAGLMSLLDRDYLVHQGATPWANIHYRAKTIEGQTHSRFKDGLEALHTTGLGLKQDTVTLRNAVRELFGEATGDSTASKAAKSFTEAAEYARERFNRAGGYIGKRDDWALPQGHEMRRVNKVSEDAWLDFIKPRLAVERMTDDTGVPLGDEVLDKGLRDSYKNIITNGASAQTAGQMGGKKLSNKHQDSRFLIFKDAKSWLEYQEKFGEPDIFATMTGHLRHMSSEIALLEVLGPNPKQAYQYLKDMAGLEDKKFLNLLDATYNVVSGQADAIAEGKYAQKIANVSGGARHGLVAAQLGSAFLSSIGDPIMGKMTRAYNGIPATKMASELVGQLDPSNDAHRALAAHLNLVADSWTHRATASARFGGEMDASAKGAKLSEFFMRASGLQSWTSAHRNAFGMSFQWHLGNQVGKPLSEIETKFQATLRRYGVTDEAWEVIRKAPLEDNQGTQYFRPDNIRQIDGVTPKQADELSSMILDAINTEMDFANPMPSARDRAIMTAGKQRGTVMGEFARMGTMYKGFAISIFNTHIMRAVTKDYTGKRDLAYLTRLVAGLTIMGGLAIQLKDISKGKNPRDINSPDFLFAAMIQGGGMGILGDFLYTGLNGKSRYGTNLATTLAGPGIGLMSDTAELGFTVMKGVDFEGEGSNVGRAFSKYLKSYTPGNSLWYTRLITERMLFDQFQRMADPKAKTSWKRTEKRMRKEQGQRFWWKKGETSPSF